MTELSRRSLLVGTAAVGVAVAGTKTIVPPANASAPVAGTQNAGWYRYKVGDFEVTVVTDGQGANPLGDSYITNTPKDAVAKDLAAQFLPNDKVIHTYTPVVINTGSKLVAIDTGLGLGAYAQSKGKLGQYQTNLKAAGIDANNIDAVIISHFHGDHINGLIGPDNKPMFPNAEIMVPETEWAFWMDESNVSKLPEVAKGQMANPKRVFGALGDKVTKYQGKRSWCPELHLCSPRVIRTATTRTLSPLATTRCSSRQMSRPVPPRSSCAIRIGNSCLIPISRWRSRRARSFMTWRPPTR